MEKESDEHRDLLTKGLAALGIVLQEEQSRAFDLYTRELLEWAGKINLTGHRDRETIEIYHYLDSLSLLQTGLLGGNLAVLDVGSGAGFPGIPLAVIDPSLSLVLLESSRKRSNFLRHLVRLLNLRGVQVVTDRAAAYAGAANRYFDRIVSRGVARMDRICGWTRSLLGDESLYIFQKGPGVSEEMGRAESGLLEMGLQCRKLIPLHVPFAKGNRYAVIIGKIKG